MVRRPAAEDAAGHGTLAYARWLDRGTKLAFLALVCSFAAYVLGLAPAHVPLAELPALWQLPIGEYLARSGVPAGWGWLGLLPAGDFLNFAGIALVAGVTLACYLRLIGPLWRAGERMLAGIAVAELAVLAAAAAGIAGTY